MQSMQWLGRLCAAALLGAAALGSAQAAFPDKPITFIVPYSPGGTTDLVAREVGRKITQKLGVSVVIENRAGAGGNIGMDAVARAKPDGYTIGLGAISTNALNPFVYKSMPFDPRKAFDGISMLGNSSIVLEVNPSIKVNSVDEFIAYARQHPGLAFATAGAGTSMHLAGVMFDQLAKTSLVHVPYKGSPPALTDLMGGQLFVMFDNLPASLPYIQAGKLTALAVTNSERAKSLPNVPTLKELGYGGATVDPWFAVYGPAGLPADVKKSLSDTIQWALADADVKSKLELAGFSPRGSSAEEVDKLSRDQYETFKQLSEHVKLSTD
ncbi:MAG TPA: tripartite tricarboxylate transporter substrate binding protein [Bordetella sp.]